MNNKDILEKANVAMANGNFEEFLLYCSEDTIWNFVGDEILRGKEEVRKYIARTYLEPPKFNVKKMIAEDDFVVAVGEISLKENGTERNYSYCDVWRFHDGKMAELKAFVV